MKQSNILFKPTLKLGNACERSINVLYCNANNTVHVHHNVRCNVHCIVHCSVHRTEHCTIEITVQSCNTTLHYTILRYTTLHSTTLYCTKQ